MTVRQSLLIKGLVQGVGFRWFTRDTARRLGLRGWVRNLPDGQVEAEAEGDLLTLDRFVEELRTGLPFARVDAIERRELKVRGEREPFDIY